MLKIKKYLIISLLLANFALLVIIAKFKIQQPELARLNLVSFGDDVGYVLKTGPLKKLLPHEDGDKNFLLLVFLNSQLEVKPDYLQDIAGVYGKFRKNGLSVLLCIGPGKNY